MKFNNLKIEHSPSRHKQQGVVLFISLMILLVLTLIGISSLNGSLLEEKMAANAQTTTTVFQSAESAIKKTYYDEKLKPGLSVTRAETRATIAPYTVAVAVDNVTENTTRSAQLETPDQTVKPRLFNSSTGTFVARGIEIVGTASMRGITESNTQGYSVFPMRP